MGNVYSKQIIVSYNLEDANKFGTNAAILLNKIIYLSEYTARDDGYCWITAADFERTTGIKQDAFTRAWKKLRDAGIILVKTTTIMGTKRTAKHFKLIEEDIEIEENTSQEESVNIEVIEKDEMSEIDLCRKIHNILGGKRDIIITNGRKKKVRQRLKNFTADEILKAAENLSMSEFHMGKNDNHMKYASLDFLIRSDEQVEKWLQQDIKSNEVENLYGGVI